MPWFPVDDGFAFHRKAVRAGNAALGLWVRAGSWSAQQLTDGYVPDDMVAVLGTPAQAARLVQAGLWEEDDRGGYLFHEWSGPGRNRTRKQVEDKRAAEAAKKSRQRAPKDSAETQGKSYARTAVGVSFRDLGNRSDSEGLFSEEPQVNDDCPQGTEGGVPQGVPGGVRVSHPIPSHPTEGHPPSEGVARKRAPRATTIPEPFVITPEMVAWANENTPGVDGRRETEKFVDYWRGKSGKDARKADWVATWRNWMRRADESGGGTAPRTGGPRPGPTPSGGRGAKAEGWLALGREMNQQLQPPAFGVIEGGRTGRDLTA